MSNYKENIDILIEVQTEVTRFQEKLSKAIRNNYSNKHYASCKRGAFDLKNELTKLTQSSKYKYGNL